MGRSRCISLQHYTLCLGSFHFFLLHLWLGSSLMVGGKQAQHKWLPNDSRLLCWVLCKADLERGMARLPQLHLTMAADVHTDCQVRLTVSAALGTGIGSLERLSREDTGGRARGS